MASYPWALPEGFDANDANARKKLAKILGGMGSQIPPEALEALRSGNIQQFQQLINFDALGEQFAPIKEVMQNFATNSGVAIYNEAKVSQQLVFDLIDERAVKWAETSSARLVREVTDEARQNIASLTAQATNGEITYQGMADLLESGGLGLTTRNARAVANSESRNFARFMNDGMSETAARIKARRMAEEYTDKLVQSRAKTIARTEIADAAMHGRYMGWESGVQSGLIDSNSVKEWIAEPDACSICLPLDGQLVSWNASYGEAVTGTTDKMPPAHPNCRCTVAILPPDYADTVFTDQANAEAEPVNYQDLTDEEIDEIEKAQGRRLKLTEDQTNSLVDYKGNESYLINDALRGEKYADDWKDEITSLDAIIDQSPELDRDLTVGRYLKGDTPISNMKVGQMFEDKAFMSTSLSSKEINLNAFGGRNIRMDIEVPKGSKGLFLDGVLGDLSEIPEEREFLLPRNTKLELLEKTTENTKVLGKDRNIAVYKFRLVKDV